MCSEKNCTKLFAFCWLCDSDPHEFMVHLTLPHVNIVLNSLTVSLDPLVQTRNAWGVDRVSLKDSQCYRLISSLLFTTRSSSANTYQPIGFIFLETDLLFVTLFNLLQDMLLKRAADIAEALYSVPRPHSQLQALPSSPAHGSVMGLGSYPSQLGVSIGDPGQSSQG